MVRSPMDSRDPSVCQSNAEELTSMTVVRSSVGFSVPNSGLIHFFGGNQSCVNHEREIWTLNSHLGSEFPLTASRKEGSPGLQPSPSSLPSLPRYDPTLAVTLSSTEVKGATPLSLVLKPSLASWLTSLSSFLTGQLHGPSASNPTCLKLNLWSFP